MCATQTSVACCVVDEERLLTQDGAVVQAVKPMLAQRQLGEENPLTSEKEPRGDTPKVMGGGWHALSLSIHCPLLQLCM